MSDNNRPPPPSTQNNPNPFHNASRLFDSGPNPIQQPIPFHNTTHFGSGHSISSLRSSTHSSIDKINTNAPISPVLPNSQWTNMSRSSSASLQPGVNKPPASQSDDFFTSMISTNQPPQSIPPSTKITGKNPFSNPSPMISRPNSTLLTSSSSSSSTTSSVHENSIGQPPAAAATAFTSPFLGATAKLFSPVSSSANPFKPRNVLDGQGDSTHGNILSSRHGNDTGVHDRDALVENQTSNTPGAVPMDRKLDYNSAQNQLGNEGLSFTPSTMFVPESTAQPASFIKTPISSTDSQVNVQAEVSYPSISDLFGTPDSNLVQSTQYVVSDIDSKGLTSSSIESSVPKRISEEIIHSGQCIVQNPTNSDLSPLSDGWGDSWSPSPDSQAQQSQIVPDGLHLNQLDVYPATNSVLPAVVSQPVTHPDQDDRPKPTAASHADDWDLSLESTEIPPKIQENPVHATNSQVIHGHLSTGIDAAVSVLEEDPVIVETSLPHSNTGHLDTCGANVPALEQVFDSSSGSTLKPVPNHNTSSPPPAIKNQLYEPGNQLVSDVLSLSTASENRVQLADVTESLFSSSSLVTAGELVLGSVQQDGPESPQSYVVPDNMHVSNTPTITDSSPTGPSKVISVVDSIGSSHTNTTTEILGSSMSSSTEKLADATNLFGSDPQFASPKQFAVHPSEIPAFLWEPIVPKPGLLVQPDQSLSVGVLESPGQAIPLSFTPPQPIASVLKPVSPKKSDTVLCVDPLPQAPPAQMVIPTADQLFGGKNDPSNPVAQHFRSVSPPPPASFWGASHGTESDFDQFGPPADTICGPQSAFGQVGTHASITKEPIVQAGPPAYTMHEPQSPFNQFVTPANTTNEPVVQFGPPANSIREPQSPVDQFGPPASTTNEPIVQSGPHANRIREPQSSFDQFGPPVSMTNTPIVQSGLPASTNPGIESTFDQFNLSAKSTNAAESAFDQFSPNHPPIQQAHPTPFSNHMPTEKSGVPNQPAIQKLCQSPPTSALFDSLTPQPDAFDSIGGQVVNSPGSNAGHQHNVVNSPGSNAGHQHNVVNSPGSNAGYQNNVPMYLPQQANGELAFQPIDNNIVQVPNAGDTSGTSAGDTSGNGHVTGTPFFGTSPATFLDNVPNECRPIAEQGSNQWNVHQSPTFENNGQEGYSDTYIPLSTTCPHPNGPDGNTFEISAHIYESQDHMYPPQQPGMDLQTNGYGQQQVPNHQDVGFNQQYDQIAHVYSHNAAYPSYQAPVHTGGHNPFSSPPETDEPYYPQAFQPQQPQQTQQQMYVSSTSQYNYTNDGSVQQPFQGQDQYYDPNVNQYAAVNSGYVSYQQYEQQQYGPPDAQPFPQQINQDSGTYHYPPHSNYNGYELSMGNPPQSPPQQPDYGHFDVYHTDGQTQFETVEASQQQASHKQWSAPGSSVNEDIRLHDGPTQYPQEILQEQAVVYQTKHGSREQLQPSASSNLAPGTSSAVETPLFQSPPDRADLENKEDQPVHGHCEMNPENMQPSPKSVVDSTLQYQDEPIVSPEPSSKSSHPTEIVPDPLIIPPSAPQQNPSPIPTFSVQPLPPATKSLHVQSLKSPKNTAVAYTLPTSSPQSPTRNNQLPANSPLHRSSPIPIAPIPTRPSKIHASISPENSRSRSPDATMDVPERPMSANSVKSFDTTGSMTPTGTAAHLDNDMVPEVISLVNLTRTPLVSPALSNRSNGANQIKCGTCGTFGPAGGRFCAWCGSPLTDTGPPPKIVYSSTPPPVAIPTMRGPFQVHLVGSKVPLVSFSPCGKMVVSFPRSTIRYSEDPSVTKPSIKLFPGPVRIVVMNDPSTKDLIHLPGPILRPGVSIDQCRATALQWLDQFRNDINIGRDVTEWENDEVREHAFDRHLLISSLHALIHSIGSVASPDSVVAAVIREHIQNLKQVKSDNDSLSDEPQESPTTNEDLLPLYNLLINPDMLPDAVEYCLTKSNWAMALALAGRCPPEIWARAIGLYAKHGLLNQPMTECGDWQLPKIPITVTRPCTQVLQFALTVLTCQGDSGCAKKAADYLVLPSDETPTPPTSAQLNWWREALLIILTHRAGGNTVPSLLELGKRLRSYGRNDAAALCHLVSQPVGTLFHGPSAFGSLDRSASEVLLGASHITYPKSYHTDTKALILTEIVELYMAAQAGNSGVLSHHIVSSEPPICVPVEAAAMPYLVGFKLAFARRLLSIGAISAALNYIRSAILVTTWTLAKDPYYFSKSLLCEIYDLAELVDTVSAGKQLDLYEGMPISDAPPDSWLSTMIGPNVSFVDLKQAILALSASSFPDVRHMLSGDEQNNIVVRRIVFPMESELQQELEDEILFSRRHSTFEKIRRLSILSGSNTPNIGPSISEDVGFQMYDPRTGLRVNNPSSTNTFGINGQQALLPSAPEKSHHHINPATTMNSALGFGYVPQQGQPSYPSTAVYPAPYGQIPMNSQVNSGYGTQFPNLPSPSEMPLVLPEAPTEESQSDHQQEPSSTDLAPKVPEQRKSPNVPDFDDDLGLGNSPLKKVSTPMDSPANRKNVNPTSNLKSVDDSSSVDNGKDDNATKENTSGSSIMGIVGRVFGRKKKETQPGPVKANLGEENSFYFDKELGRWVNKKDSASASPSVSKPQMPPPRTGSAPPPPRNGSSPPATGISDGMGSSLNREMTNTPNLGATNAHRAHVSGRMTPPTMTQPYTANNMANRLMDNPPSSRPSSSLGFNLMDDGVGAPPPGPTQSTVKPLRGKSRYVDVFNPSSSSATSSPIPTPIPKSATPISFLPATNAGLGNHP